MIVVSGTISLDPAKVDEFVAASNDVVQATLQETGCDVYGFWLDTTKPGLVRVFEEWADQTAIDAHFSTPHMQAFLGRMAEFGITGTDIHAYEVEAKRKLM